MDQGKPPRVMYVEDDITLATLFTMRMQAEGFEVLAVHDGDSALQQAKEFKPDLILCDLMMPSLSGYDVIDILRHTSETSAAKIVAISALSQPEDIERATISGADDYIVKSQLVLDEIMERLRFHLGLPPSVIKSVV